MCKSHTQLKRIEAIERLKRLKDLQKRRENNKKLLREYKFKKQLKVYGKQNPREVALVESWPLLPREISEAIISMSPSCDWNFYNKDHVKLSYGKDITCFSEKKQRENLMKMDEIELFRTEIKINAMSTLSHVLRKSENIRKLTLHECEINSQQVQKLAQALAKSEHNDECGIVINTLPEKMDALKKEMFLKEHVPQFLDYLWHYDLKDDADEKVNMFKFSILIDPHNRLDVVFGNNNNKTMLIVRNLLKSRRLR